LGSFPNKKIQEVNDIDLFIILEKLTPKFYIEIIEKFEKISREISTNKIKVIVETRMGPVKPKAEKGKKIIMFHLLIYEKFFVQKIREPVWVNALHKHKLLQGKQLSKLRKLKRISKDALFEDLKRHEKEIENKFTSFYSYKIIKNKLKLFTIKQKTSKNYIIESIKFHIDVALMNYFCYNGIIVGKDEFKLKKLLQKFPSKLSEDYANVINSYNKSNIKSLRNFAQLFLYDLHDLI
jgi:hypothetical protein